MSSVGGSALGAVVGAAVCLAASPYLARLTRSVPDRDERRWWVGRTASRARLVLVAVLAAGLGALAGAAAGVGALLPAFLALAVLGTPLAVIDLDVHRLPDRLVRPAAGTGLVLLGLAALVRRDGADLVRAIEGAAAVFAVLYALAFAAPRSFGFGDVKLGGVLGLYLGWFGWRYVCYGIFGGFALGAVAGLALMATRRASLKSHLAFGPALIVGALTVLAFDLVPSA